MFLTDDECTDIQKTIEQNTRFPIFEQNDSVLQVTKIEKTLSSDIYNLVEIKKLLTRLESNTTADAINRTSSLVLKRVCISLA